MTMTRKPYGEKLITGEGMGGFLCPPGHPCHHYHVQTGRRDNPNSMQSLESAAKSEWLSPAMRGRASGILKRWQANRMPLESEQVQEWVRQVLGYFQGCYKGQDTQGNPSWNASDLRIMKDVDPVLNADLHAGVHLIREYYPEFTPTAEHFALAYWGSKPQPA